MLRLMYMATQHKFAATFADTKCKTWSLCLVPRGANLSRAHYLFTTNMLIIYWLFLLLRIIQLYLIYTGTSCSVHLLARQGNEQLHQRVHTSNNCVLLSPATESTSCLCSIIHSISLLGTSCSVLWTVHIRKLWHGDLRLRYPRNPPTH